MSINSDSVAVITGAASGIGRALAVRFAEESVRGVVIADVDLNGLEETEDQVRRLGTDCLSVETDVSDLESVKALSSAVKERFGTASHLVNNAGVAMVGRTHEVSIEDMEWLIGINFWGTVYGTKVFLPVFQDQGHGHIVNISSVFGLMAPPGQATYCASKFAVRGFTESLRHELDGTDIHVSCVHPGGIRTEIVRKARQGANAPDEDKKIAPVIFDKVARTPPEVAADVIVKGIKAKNPRILIGSDALKISAIQRAFPTRYFRIMDWISGGMLSKFR
ncbi:MAG: SDR family NAD(P)-dependent oxidoreductase [Acidobacteriota bacterium]|nr:MAG: SDR family NAD(P)-dependent oxidoreductase [Acidobacteriota bacterium]